MASPLLWETPGAAPVFVPACGSGTGVLSRLQPSQQHGADSAPAFGQIIVSDEPPRIMVEHAVRFVLLQSPDQRGFPCSRTKAANARTRCLLNMGLSQGNAGHSQQPLSFFCLQQLKGWHHDLSLHPSFLHPAHGGSRCTRSTPARRGPCPFPRRNTSGPPFGTRQGRPLLKVRNRIVSAKIRAHGHGDDDAQPTERMGGDKRQDGKPERFLKIAFGIVLSGKPDPHGLCGVIPFGYGGAFKGADGVPGFLGKNGEAEEPLS